MSISYVYQGASDPDALVIDITPSEALPDLTVVTGGHIDAYSRDGSEQEWDFTIVAQTADLLTIQHTFDAAGAEVAQPGRYRLVVYLDLPVGGRRCVPMILEVRKL